MSSRHFNYHRHMFSHVKQPWFHCEYCEKNISIESTKTALSQHKCRICDVPQFTIIQYTEHMEKQHDIRVYKSGKKYTPKDKQPRKAAPTKLECDNCGWTTNRHFNYHRHVLKHCSKGRTFHCNYCDKPIGLDSTKTSYGIDFRKCMDCGQNFYHLPSYHEHVKLGCSRQPPGKLLCTVCQKSFKWVEHLKDHIQCNHIDDILTNKDKDTEVDVSDLVQSMMGRNDNTSGKLNMKRVIHCGICDWMGDVHYNYHRHNFLHTDYKHYTCKHCHKHIDPEKYNVKSSGSQRNVYPKTKKEPKPSNPRKYENLPYIVCEQCGFTTKRTDLFKKHQVEHVPEEDRVVYRCDHCSYESFYQSSLRSHIAAKHEKKGKFQLTGDMILCCELCGTFSTESRDDILTHKQDLCPYRNKSLAVLKKLEIESKITTKGKTFEQEPTVLTQEQVMCEDNQSQIQNNDTYNNAEKDVISGELIVGNSTTDNVGGVSDNTGDCSTPKLQGISSDLLNIKVPNPMQVGRTRKQLLPVKQRVYICDHCEFMCLRRWNMVRHKECLHKRKDTTCHLCGYTTKYLPWLYSHYKKTHFQDPPEEIKTWMEEYRKNRMKFIDKEKPKGEASRIHTMQNEVCHLCGKSLKSSLLKKHMKTAHSEHVKSQEYSCHHDRCNFTTVWCSYLARHVKRVHMGIKPEKNVNRKQYTCEECQINFDVKKEFNQHCKMYHGNQTLLNKESTAANIESGENYQSSLHQLKISIASTSQNIQPSEIGDPRQTVINQQPEQMLINQHQTLIEQQQQQQHNQFKQLEPLIDGQQQIQLDQQKYHIVDGQQICQQQQTQIDQQKYEIDGQQQTVINQQTYPVELFSSLLPTSVTHLSDQIAAHQLMYLRHSLGLVESDLETGHHQHVIVNTDCNNTGQGAGTNSNSGPQLVTLRQAELFIEGQPTVKDNTSTVVNDESSDHIVYKY